MGGGGGAGYLLYIIVSFWYKPHDARLQKVNTV